MTQLRSLVRRVVRGQPLTKVGRGPINLIDVGSFGDMPLPWRNHAAAIGHVLLFDPLEPAGGHQRLNQHVTVYNSALWDSPEERDFYVHGRNGSGSSLLCQNVEYVQTHFGELRMRGPRALADTWFKRAEVSAVHRVHCDTLDNVIARLDDGIQFHVLKIDTQGAESRILAGAQSFLAQDCLAVHLELFTVPLYVGIALLPEVQHTLDGLGFDFAMRMPAHGTFDSQHDCLFLKRGAVGEVMDAIRGVYGLGQQS